MKRYLFSSLFVVAGAVLLLVPHNLTIRGGGGVDFGWLVLGIGVVSLALDFIRRPKQEPAPAARPAEPPKSPEPPSPPAPPASPAP